MIYVSLILEVEIYFGVTLLSSRFSLGVLGVGIF